MKHTKITVIFGTRPEAIKLCPLILELKKREFCELRVITSGQHRELCREVLDFFGIAPDVDFDIMSDTQSLFDITEKIFARATKELSESRPDILVVHGDTTTAFSACLAAFYLGIRIAHVEAGLRSDDLFSPFPEEFNRRAIDAMSFFHFSPTEHAKGRLLIEGILSERIFVTGNTIVDALNYTKEKRPHLAKKDGVRLLLTLHRREIRGQKMSGILRAVARAAKDFPELSVCFPVHPASEVRDSAKILSGIPSVELLPPLPLPDFHALMDASDIILSDSGGVCEEAVSLGKPFLLARDVTERPEGILSGGVVPVGTDEEDVYRALCRFISSSAEREKIKTATNPFGDGHASERIADILLS